MKRAHLGFALTAMIAVAAGWSAGPARAQQAGPVRSWLYVDHSADARVMVEGDEWDVPVEYYVDPAEAPQGAQLTIWGGGPWIDNPDGKYVQQRHHVSYPGLNGAVDVQPGRGRYVFKLRVPPALRQNAVLLIASLRNAAGRPIAGEFRRGRMWFVRRGGWFELETDKPGNLFTYDEPVVLSIRLRNVKDRGASKTLAYRVWDATGSVVAEGSVPFTVERDGQEVPIPLELNRRGLFQIEVDVPGWEKRDTTFGRIPDLMAITGGAPTRFGMTNVVMPGPAERVEELCAVARRLGLTSCRDMFAWYDMEPGPGVFKLDPWEEALQIGRKHGIDTWLCVYAPPAWAMVGPQDAGSYRAVRVDWDAWRSYVRTVSERFRDSIYGWEWLNEITPGGTADPVADYLTMCRIATETAKAVNPDFVTLLAGGLWPRTFRIDMLKAGVGRYIDVLPIHYSDGTGVTEAREDLASAGLERAQVWDDETARGRNAWDVPPLEELQNTQQCSWILSQWPDELAAGCDRIIYFGGEGAPAGNWTYLLGDLRPRPVAVTLAVLTSKMFSASPLGVFWLGNSGVFHLFEQSGKPVLVCSTQEDAETVLLETGERSVTVTDYQGNEMQLDTEGGVASLPLKRLPVFVEGGDLDVLQAYCVPQIGAVKRARGAETPRTSMLVGRENDLDILVRNLYDRPLGGTIALNLPPGWTLGGSTRFSVAAGEQSVVTLSVVVPAQAEARDYPLEATFGFDWDKLPGVTKPLVASVLSPEMLGNLLDNDGFETADASGGNPEGWQVNGTTSQWTSSEGLGLGLGKKVVRFAQSDDYVSIGRTLALRGGQTYLYTAWVWAQNMPAGSNVYMNMTDGTRRALYDVQVFRTPENTPYWQMLTARVNTPENLRDITFSPLARGPGQVLLDNVRVTRFEGTDFAAECYPAQATVRIDGSLDDWVTRCPLPLVGRNQLTIVREGYKWTPQNLNGVAYLMHDNDNLYVAVEVMDDQQTALTGDEAPQGDGLILGFDPTNRGPDAQQKGFAYYISSAVPGGGSGKHTIFRPEAHSGGLRTGHLFRDSSVYDMAISSTNGRTVYEIRIPFSELGAIQPVLGGKFAFSVQLDDNDGAGLEAHMNWGGGISPSWRPADFGVATFVEGE